MFRLGPASPADELVAASAQTRPPALQGRRWPMGLYGACHCIRQRWQPDTRRRHARPNAYTKKHPRSATRAEHSATVGLWRLQPRHTDAQPVQCEAHVVARTCGTRLVLGCHVLWPPRAAPRRALREPQRSQRHMKPRSRRRHHTSDAKCRCQERGLKARAVSTNASRLRMRVGELGGRYRRSHRHHIPMRWPPVRAPTLRDRPTYPRLFLHAAGADERSCHRMRTIEARTRGGPRGGCSGRPRARADARTGACALVRIHAPVRGSEQICVFHVYGSQVCRAAKVTEGRPCALMRGCMQERFQRTPWWGSTSGKAHGATEVSTDPPSPNILSDQAEHECHDVNQSFVHHNEAHRRALDVMQHLTPALQPTLLPPADIATSRSTSCVTIVTCWRCCNVHVARTECWSQAMWKRLEHCRGLEMPNLRPMPKSADTAKGKCHAKEAAFPDTVASLPGGPAATMFRRTSTKTRANRATTPPLGRHRGEACPQSRIHTSLTPNRFSRRSAATSNVGRRSELIGVPTARGRHEAI